jgi:hypothetical protein
MLIEPDHHVSPIDELGLLEQDLSDDAGCLSRHWDEVTCHIGVVGLHPEPRGCPPVEAIGRCGKHQSAGDEQ